MVPSKPPITSLPERSGIEKAERVIVAVKAEKVISKSALAWALTHVARPVDCITLLAIFSKKKPVRVRIKVVSVISAGAVAAESKSSGANWVILDKTLKQELKHCMNELHCNIVVMKGSHPKVLRLNLSSSNDLQTPFYSAAYSPIKDSENPHSYNMKHTTPVSSPEGQNTSYTRSSRYNSLSSPDTGASIFVVYEQNPLYEGLNKGKNSPYTQNSFEHLRERAIGFSATPESATCRNQRVFWIAQNHTVDEKGMASGKCNKISKITFTPTRTISENFTHYKDEIMVRAIAFNQSDDGDYVLGSSIREAVSLSKTSSTPPPLCSLCHFKAPAFGKPPKQFHYGELEEATDGFSDTNFVAEGGFGLVHRGILRNGLIIAVKQLKLVGPQRDADFCREVRVLSCAQHRNVVLLIGFCIEGKKRLLVYEYICNSSLDFHLHGNEIPILDWQARLKIAIGTARGLRYLHEDCRVGCIIHRNLRPDNILLTHDFEPLVADFGLARLHNEWKFFDTNQVVGTSGYLAPEYFNDGNMTEKVDIYAFGLQDPVMRPPMSKVVKMLEGGSSVIPLAFDLDLVGCRSGHMQGLNSNALLESKRRHSLFVGLSVVLLLVELVFIA
ncbi:hypothetical protein DH2020_007697 [Rehmannia glutinosa]|uniref:Protein kinase domain-containing protein n=1 Tax=Rehmannia glutinosa TaxID=99300 RepID=A0ABR0TYU6_REHGL